MTKQVKSSAKEFSVGQEVTWQGTSWLGLKQKVRHGVISSAPTVKKGKTGYYVVVKNRRFFVPVERIISG